MAKKRKTIKKTSSKKITKRKISKRKVKSRRRNPSMTYGILPKYEDFSKAFDKEVPGGLYRIRKDKRVGDVDLSKIELWFELNKAVEEDTDSSLDWASAVLSTLNFEWI
jgi:hypothetical protein